MSGDFGSGFRGDTPGPTTDRDAYQAGYQHGQDMRAGQASIDQAPSGRRSAWGSQPAVSVSPIGCAAVMVAPALFIVYPLAGAAILVGLFAGIAVGEFVFGAPRGAQFLIGLVPMLAMIPVGMRLETFANRFFIYRWLRYPFRIGLLGSWLVLMILTNGEWVTGLELETIWNHASARQVFYSYAAFPIVLAFSMFMDHFGFPAMGQSPQRLAARAEQAALVASGDAPAAEPFVIGLPLIGGFLLAIVLSAVVTPLNIGETAVIAAVVFWAVIRRRRKRAES